MNDIQQVAAKRSLRSLLLKVAHDIERLQIACEHVQKINSVELALYQAHSLKEEGKLLAALKVLKEAYRLVSDDINAPLLQEVIENFTAKEGKIRKLFFEYLEIIKLNNLEKVPECFISYVREEGIAEWVKRELAYDLKNKGGLKICFDERGLTSGINVDILDPKIAIAQFLIFFVTPLYNTKAQPYKKEIYDVSSAIEEHLLERTFFRIKHQFQGKLILALKNGFAGISIPFTVQPGLYTDYRDADNYFTNTLRVSRCLL